MLRSTPEWQAFEREQIRREKPGYHRNAPTFAAMLRWARKMGALPLKEPLDGIEHDIRLARALNARLRTPADRPR